MKKVLKLLMIPYNSSIYYNQMLRGFAEAFRSKGHKVIVLSNIVSKETIRRYIEIEKIDLIISINRFIGCDFEISIPLFCWIQDTFIYTEEIISNKIGLNEYVYTLGSPFTLGFKSIPKKFIGSLVTGVDKKIIQRNNEFVWNRDISICGFIPDIKNDRFIYTIDKFLDRLTPNHWMIYQYLCTLISKNYISKKIRITIQDYVESLYQPLKGGLKPKELGNDIMNLIGLQLPTFVTPKAVYTHMLDNVVDFHGVKIETTHKLITTKILRLIDFYVNTYPRGIDRRILADLTIDNFTDKIIEFNGYGWDTYQKYKSYSRPNIDKPEKLYEAYRGSKINLHNNTHGMGLHSRVLEAMAVGGFVMTHRSDENDSLEGGILTAFEANEHFGFYDVSNFKESIECWLDDDYRRINTIKKAQEEIIKNHLWEDRVEQVIKDYYMVLEKKSE